MKPWLPQSGSPACDEVLAKYWGEDFRAAYIAEGCTAMARFLVFVWLEAWAQTAHRFEGTLALSRETYHRERALTFALHSGLLDVAWPEVLR